MKCPSCNIELKMSERQGVEIDYCPQCRGVWLDRGELDKIIERMESTSYAERREGYSRKGYERESREEYEREPHRRKKKSFWGDFFDFD